ncbi:MAG: purine-nucleoside phosphorylase [Thermomonas sp.]|nr:purine-nucleoside phosphorylase [Thermomonas sp.]
MPTPHISAAPGAFADTVLLPGDPLRAEHIARTLLDDAVEVTRVRAMAGFTGSWNGRPVSVMGTGMGIPSSSIYATKLVREYGVRRLLRIGTCGAVSESLRLGDIVLGQGACTDSGVNRSRFRGMDFAAIAGFDLLAAVAATARERRVPVAIGNLFSADLFYHPEPTLVDALDAMGVLGIEMEAAGLYGIAAEHRVQALAVCAVSDHLRSHASWSPQQRQCGVDDMVRLVLDAVIGAPPPGVDA